METKKLYEDDPYLKEFDAKVLEVQGNKVVLDRTCFFARGGGQVSDKGEINGIKVVDVFEEDGKIYHVLEKEASFKIGDSVHGKIDWERRYRIMRLHSAAHLVYFVMQKIFPGCKNASPGLIDEEKDRTDYFLPRKPTPEELNAIEMEVNKLIEMDLEIKRWKEDDKLFWKVEPFPEMLCCGTHVRRTSEIGKVAIKIGKKPGKGKERIEITLVD